MKKNLIAALVLFGVLSAATSTTTAAQTPCTSAESTTCRGRITLDNGYKIPYWRTYPTGTANSRVVRAVIVIHGINRNADAYFSYIVDAAQRMGLVESTLILAIHFQTAEDDHGLDELFWSSNLQWVQGDPSVNGGGVSSFTIIDQIVQRAADRARFPNLTRIVITGHSAGGQFTNRYAGGSRAQNTRTSHRFHYIIANPSSFLYLNSLRPVLTDSDMDDFYIPDTSCLFNRYPYGLDDRNSFMRAVSPSTIRRQYQSRRVTYLLGTADTGSSDLDERCQANFQGTNRFERGNWFFQYIQALFPTSFHDKVKVPGAGHSAYDMYTSPRGRRVLFR